MKKLNFEQVLKEISKSIINAKERIYATHLLEKKKDLNLPINYVKALQKTKCINKKRVIFGDNKLFNDFNASEKYFENIFSSKKYFRMLLVDNELYFKYKSIFYKTQKQEIINMFEQYFYYIN